MNTAIICGGVLEYAFIREFLIQTNVDCVIAADRGLQFCYTENLMPDYILGDYDSIRPEILDWFKSNAKVPMVTYPAEKDDTDTALAIEKALELESTAIYLLGALGGRMDHGLANIQMLKRILDAGDCKGYIADAQNLICLVDKEDEIKKSEQFGKYVSFLPFTDEVKGVTLEGFKYPLEEYCMKKGSSIGVSNEIVQDVCKVSVKEGILLMIQSRDL